jgi:polyferredoxin
LTADASNRSRARLYTRIRRAVQIVALSAFLAAFLAARRGAALSGLANVPMRLDPLAALANALAGREFLADMLLSLLVVALTLGFGRAWCGWLCPLGTLLDVFAPRRKRVRALERAEPLRKVKTLLLLVVLTSALLGSLSLMILDPLTLLTRSLASGAWPALDRLVLALETGMYRLPPLAPLVARIDSVLRPAVFAADPLPSRAALGFGLLFAAILGLDWVAERFWCRYLCPLGGLLGLLSRVAIARRHVSTSCNACGACAHVCPTATIRVDRQFESDPAECTMCLECLAACPRKGIEFTPSRGLAPGMDYDPRRRELLVALGGAVAGTALLRSQPASPVGQPHWVQPPGAREQGLIGKCLRCGECTRACPTGAIHPAIAEAGIEGLWTPVLVLRLGYCDFSCTAWGDICPVSAIPRLDLAVKRRTVIGVAYIDKDRCIAWADLGDCIVCEEMCPLPEKAIVLDRVEVTRADGTRATVQQPRVLREQCIGCGICENKCPLSGQAAIRVWAPNASLPL